MAKLVMPSFHKKGARGFVKLGAEYIPPEVSLAAPAGTSPTTSPRRRSESLLDCMRGLFGRIAGRRKRKVNEGFRRAKAIITETSVKLRLQSEKLQLEKDKRSFALVQCLQSGDKKQARIELLLKKRYQKQIVRCNTHLYNLEAQLLAIDESASNREVVDLLQGVHKVMKTIGPCQDLAGKLEDVQDGLRELHDDAHYANTILDEQHVFDLLDMGGEDEASLDEELKFLAQRYATGGGGGLAASGRRPPVGPSFSPPCDATAISLVEAMPKAPQKPCREPEAVTAFL
jgi:hypothetical protein